MPTGVADRFGSEALAQLERELLSWDGVTVHPHRFGGREFRLGTREIGHIHGDRMADLPFPKRVRDELVSSGRAQPHHLLPESGWVSFYPKAGDLERLLGLFRMNHELALEQRRGRLERERLRGNG